MYKLSNNLLGHTSDVRALTTTKEGHIVTSSRDLTTRLWKKSADGQYETDRIYYGHTSYVMSVCIIENDCHQNFIATGGKDGKIIIFGFDSSDVLVTLKEHKEAVSCLHYHDGILLSGSWDNTCSVWNMINELWTKKQILQSHSGAVWAVRFVEASPNIKILTASADKTIRLWKDGKVEKIFHGHTDCVRGLSVIGQEYFLSCSNDASIKFWRISTGECINTCYGHNNYIYGISKLNNNIGFVSCGEDRTLRLWHENGDIGQTIYVPTQSVWCVDVLPLGDVVCGSSDGICRIFSCDISRQLTSKEQEKFETEVKKARVSEADLGGLKRENMPGKEGLLVKGKKEGETLMVRDGEKVLCYSWNGVQWVQVGEVVGASSNGSSGRKVSYEGKEYDYVFDVEIDTGLTLKLPFNIYEDPFEAAQKFIHKNDLPQDFLDQVAKFIVDNAKGVTLGGGAREGYQDPFTGSGRYVPSGSNVGMAEGGVDPFTGGGRYVSSGEADRGLAGGIDPFTGGGRYVAGSGTSAGKNVSPETTMFPQKIPLQFEAINISGMKNKLKEFNERVSVEVQLNDSQIDNIIQEIQAGGLGDVGVFFPLKVALQWPPELVWPVLDLLRLCLRLQKVQESFLTNEEGLTLVSLLVSFISPSCIVNTQLLTLRCLANFAIHSNGRQLLLTCRDKIICSVVNMLPMANKNLEVAAATILLNYCVVLFDCGTLDDICQVASSLGAMLMNANDIEAKYRLLIGVGTLLGGEGGIQRHDEVKALLRSLDLARVVTIVKEEGKVGDCARLVKAAIDDDQLS